MRPSRAAAAQVMERVSPARRKLAIDLGGLIDSSRAWLRDLLVFAYHCFGNFVVRGHLTAVRADGAPLPRRCQCSGEHAAFSCRTRSKPIFADHPVGPCNEQAGKAAARSAR